mgnify:CR=1 FL=1
MSLHTPAVQQGSAIGQDAHQDQGSGSGYVANVISTEKQKTKSTDFSEELLPGSLGEVSSLETRTWGSGAKSTTSDSSASGEGLVKNRASSTINGEPEQVVSSASGLDESVALSSTSGEGNEQPMSLKTESSDNQLLPGSVGAAEGPNLMSMNTPNVDVSGSGKEVENVSSGEMVTSGDVESASGESEVTVTPLLSKKDSVTETSGDSTSGKDKSLASGSFEHENFMSSTATSSKVLSSSASTSAKTDEASGERNNLDEYNAKSTISGDMSGSGSNFISTDSNASKKNTMPRPIENVATVKQTVASADLPPYSGSGSGDTSTVEEGNKVTSEYSSSAQLPGSDGRDENISSSGSGDLSSALESAIEAASGMDFFQHQHSNEMLPEVKKTKTETVEENEMNEEIGGDVSSGSVMTDSSSSSEKNEEETMKSSDEEQTDDLQKTSALKPKKAKDEEMEEPKKEAKNIKSKSSNLAHHPGLAAALTTSALSHVPVSLGSSSNTYGLGSGTGIDYGSVGDVISGTASGMGTLELTPAKDPSEVVMKLFGSASGSEGSAEEDQEKDETSQSGSRHAVPVHHHKKEKVSDNEKEEKENKDEEVCKCDDIKQCYSC